MTVAREGARWEELAQQDPMWAILSYPDGKYGRWDEEQFFRHGVERIDDFLGHGLTLQRPVGHETALDFGCGVGRLSRALAQHFDHVTGIDISETMIRHARQLNAEIANLEFRRNDRADLSLFSDAAFDLVASDIVLQHLPDRATVQSYLAEFIRVLRPEGLLVFELPSSLPLAVRAQPRRTAYRMLRRIGLPAHTLYWRLGLHPNRMLSVAETEVITWIRSHGAQVLDVVKARDPAVETVRENVYYVTR